MCGGVLMAKEQDINKREVAVANIGDLKDGEMRQVAGDGTDVLLARVEGEYHAVGAHCPHYGAPLVDGCLSGDRIVCPWHHACFNARTGRVEEPPAIDSLPTFDLRIDGDKVVVSISEET